MGRTNMSLGVIAGGRAAWAFARTWRAVGRPIAGIALREGSRSPIPEVLGIERLSIEELSRRADLLFIAAPDGAIPDIARRLGTTVDPSKALFHASGSLTSEVFGGHPGGFSLHPLRALPAVGEPVELARTLFVFEGSDRGRSIAREFVTRIDGRVVEIEAAQKTLYHAAAVFAANHVAALLDVAHEMMQHAGLPADVKPQLAELARSAVENWTRHDTTKRFTGPVARADRAVLERHFEALEGDSARLALYRMLSLEIARAVTEGSDREESRALAQWLAAPPDVP